MDASELNLERPVNVMDALNGDHLHWSEFRRNVLQPFRIVCSNSPRSEHIPTTFLARLQSNQKNTVKYDDQRKNWRSNVGMHRSVGLSPIFPPSLIPQVAASSVISRCMMPNVGREGLPLRGPSVKRSLYELPTAKPYYACGFNFDLFEKSEQYYLNGALRVSGSAIDFERGEIIRDKIICCPFLVFEKIATNMQEDMETARNHCAVAGAQNLRGQQQLFHRAFGLQTISQPPITFTCAVNNEQSVINFHCVDDQGNFTMAALCKFNLQDDDHYNNFQIWIETIESWASTYLLPRIKGALKQASQMEHTPPASPSPSLTNLSINTSSDSVILPTLRRCWPDIRWQQQDNAETPINSSIAQCATPMPARNLYSHESGLSSTTPKDNEERLLPCRRPSNILSPIRTNMSGSQQIQTPRPLSAVSSLSRDFFDGKSTLSTSPCRPPSLSPCSPEPEAPFSSKNPVLVLRRRLDVAVNEIQELRGQVEMLQNTLTYKTQRLERCLEMVLDSRQVTPIASHSRHLLSPSFGKVEVPVFMDCEDRLNTPTIPGSFSQMSEGDVVVIWQSFVHGYRTFMRMYKPAEIVLLLICCWLGCSALTVNLGDLIISLVLTVLSA